MPIIIKKKKKKKAQKVLRPKGYKRIYDMGKEYVYQLDALLALGKSANEMARIIKNDWGFYRGIKDASLAKQILRYYQGVVVPNLQEIKSLPALETDSGELKGKPLKSINSYATLKEVASYVDVAMGLNELSELQRLRLYKLYNKEELIPTLNSSLTKEFKLYLDILAKLGDFQLNTGIVTRVARRIEIEEPTELEKAGRVDHNKSVEQKRELDKLTKKAQTILLGEYEVIEDD